MTVELLATSQQAELIVQGRYADVFGWLGPHSRPDGRLEVRVFLPGALQVAVVSDALLQPQLMTQLHQDGVFAVVLEKPIEQYQLRVDYPFSQQYLEDPYRFDSSLSEQDLYLFNEGTQQQLYQHFGAQCRIQQGVAGVRFVVWAPNAQSVAVVGDFNHWHGSSHRMRKHPAQGVWELFVPTLTPSATYKYRIESHRGDVQDKADPLAFAMQHPPHTASCVASIRPIANHPTQRNHIDQPISIYEVHLGSWRRHADGRYLSYLELAEQLVPYVQALGFSHVQFMPISEFPFDGSWGYQPVGLFAPTSRFGSAEDLQQLIQAFKQQGIGVLIDWVPGHFPTDSQGLASFDGTHLYEHADTRKGFHPDWNTLIYNYGRHEVVSTLVSNACYWFDYFAVDGLRVDAVASMLYLDYSRNAGQWLPNQYGGRENLEAIAFLQQVNRSCYARFPGIMMVAEESTAWPGVTQATDHGGLGFGYKWNMGWMNDSLRYMARDPLYRHYHHHDFTFSLVYAFSENYILPISHDEVVHGKGSMLAKMPGDDWQKFANLRAFYSYMWSHPGKKLLFMGCEFGQWQEWNHNLELQWDLLQYANHQGLQLLVKTLNGLYRQYPALHQLDQSAAGFRWLDANNAKASVFSYARFSQDGQCVVVAVNMTPQVWSGFRLGVPHAGRYRCLLNSDAACFGGSNMAISDSLPSAAMAANGLPDSVQFDLPPLAAVYLLWESA